MTTRTSRSIPEDTESYLIDDNAVYISDNSENVLVWVTSSHQAERRHRDDSWSVTSKTEIYWWENSPLLYWDSELETILWEVFPWRYSRAIPEDSDSYIVNDSWVYISDNNENVLVWITSSHETERRAREVVT